MPRHSTTCSCSHCREGRFWDRVGNKTQSGCILWIGVLDEEGYGRFSLGAGKHARASRFAYELFRDAIPHGLLVLHTCDNPSCVNPAHLFLGTDLDNSNDKVAKGRHCRGESRPASKITEDDVRTIRRRYNNGELQRIIAKDFGLSQRNVSDIARGIAWKHVT